MERTIIQLEPETKEKLRTLAFKENCSVAALIRKAIQRLLEEQEG